MQNDYSHSIEKVVDVFLNEIKENGLSSFPLNTWKKLGREGLLGLNIPHEFSGENKKHSHVIRIGEQLVEKGLSMGMALSWLLHLGTQYFLIYKNVQEPMKTDILGYTTKGEKTVAIAYGEPGFYGKPQNLKAMIEREKESVLVSGVKTYITNGTIADYYTVFGKESTIGERAEISAYIIDKNTNGLKVLRKIDVKALEPSPHCEIEFTEALSTEECRVGEKGRAYEDILKPMRDFENAYMVGPLLGASKRMIKLIEEVKKSFSKEEENIYYEKLGYLQTSCITMDVLAERIGEKIDWDDEAVELVTAFKLRMFDFNDYATKMIAENLKVEGEVLTLNKEIEAFLAIGKNIVNLKLRNIGKKMKNQI